ncbi:CHAT domain-containing protein [Nostoc sp. CHAB 5784]|uniref:nSTAND1 domain-containing NTPase n=1 Tax=Nostoc mirabile TaxID=2907820 RepID=UPI001E375ACB|nr:CHAT domain-containing protein [Nostoc mirabile]MCC5664434.1 CHAT domain-containing protein [Nostoc mirabile CHAB5784]
MNTFEINIQRKSGSHWPIVVEHSRPGELMSSRSEGILQLSPENFQKLTSLLGQPKDYGIFLGKALFHEEIRDAFVSALRNSEETVRVLLFIEAEDSELRTLRWERLCGNIDDGWHLLTLEQRTPFSLYIPAITDRRFPPIGRRDLRALILVASPSEIERFSLDSFNVEAAVESVRQALGEIPCDVLATVEGAIGLPTLDELCKHLTDRTKQYTMLHFVSHSKVIEQGETVFYWAKADNKVDPVTGTRLIERLRTLRGAKGLPHFTFLSTCESASPEAEAALGGLGQRLVRDLGMPAVIAMTEKVTVKTALALAEGFYRQLRESGEVDSALHEAVAFLAERGDVTVPALFSRLGGKPLFSDQLDRELTNADIQYGLQQFEKLLSERGPALRPWLSEQAQKLGNSLGADITALSKQARQEREQVLEEVNTLCQEIIDLSFNALALGQQPPAYNARCPFLGLYPFREENREFFFGREELIAQLQEKLRQHNFLAVLGASGSGKSSVVLAGLIPALQKKQPLVVSYMTPSSNPIEQLQATLAEVQNEKLYPPFGYGEWGIGHGEEAEMIPVRGYLLQQGETHPRNNAPFLQSADGYSSPPKALSLPPTFNKSAILVIDQFEELFTLCADETQRVDFIQQVLNLTQHQKVVITMRADFWGECAPYCELKELMEARQKLIGPMDAAQLRKAMEMQAAKVGLRFEAGLSNSILDDVQGEPGAMPLLQHALLELWKRRHGRWLQALEYEAIGGVNMAIAQTADDVYNGLSLPEQAQVQNIFIRLTRLDDSAIQGDKRRDTRRRVWLDELVPAGGTIALIKELVNRLAGEGARLVVTSVDGSTNREEVEVAHEALIRHWPRLLNWLDENRTNLQLRETIRQAALEWEKQQKDDNYLVHRGGRLEDAQVLAKQAGFLNQLEADYVNACVELRLRQEKEKEARRRREIRTAWGVATGAVVAVIISGSLGGVALDQKREAKITKAEAISQSSSALFDSHKELEALTEGIKAGKILKEENVTRPLAIAALHKGVYQVKERNSLEHQNPVLSVVFSPNGNTIASASDDGTVKLWDLKGKLLHTFQGHQNPVLSVVFSPDSNTIASVSPYGLDTTVELWDLKGKLQHTLEGVQKGFISMVFSPDGNTIASANTDGTVKLWDLSGKELRTFQSNQKGLTSMVFSPDSHTIASASDDKTLKLWDLQGNLLQNFQGHQDKVTSVVFSPDGNTIASSSDDRTVKLWDLSGKELHTFQGNQKGLTSMVFSPDGNTIASASDDKTVKLWDLQGNLLQNFQGHQDKVTSVVFSPDGNTIASSSDDRTVKLWDLSGKELHTFQGNQKGLTSMVFSPDGNTIASSGYDGTVKLWDLKGKPIQIFQGDEQWVTSVVFSPDGNTIASGSYDGTVKLWDLSGKEPQNFQDNQNSVTSVVFSPKGNTIASASVDGTIKLWNLKGKPPQTFQSNQKGLTSVVFSPNGNTIASASNDKTVKLWDLQGNLLQNFQGHQKGLTSVVFSPNGNTIASASNDKTVKLWDLQGNLLQNFQGHQKGLTSVVFSPNGKTIASASDDGTVKLWDLQGNLLQNFQGHQNLRGHQNRVKSVVFSPDGKTIASASDDGTVILWDWDLDSLMVSACDWARDYLKNSQEVKKDDRKICDGIGKN